MFTTDTLAVSASGLVKTFGDQRAVDGIDLEVRRGEVFGVLGPNGAGKTTMLKMLATLLPIDGGPAEIFGHDVRREGHVIRQLLGVTGQYASVDENLTATENLLLFGRLQGLSRGDSRRRAGHLLEQFDLTEAATKPISAFSGDMRRRLDLAASLITRPPLIFLDEPSTGWAGSRVADRGLERMLCLVRRAFRRSVAQGLVCAGHQVLDQPAVHLAAGQAQSVASVVPLDQRPVQGAEAGDEHLQGLGGLGGPVRGPDLLDEALVGPPAWVGCEQGEQRGRPVAGDGDTVPGDAVQEAQPGGHPANP
jgi:ABC-type Na+ transport system ATPase subunit NatA